MGRLTRFAQRTRRLFLSTSYFSFSGHNNRISSVSLLQVLRSELIAYARAITFIEEMFVKSFSLSFTMYPQQVHIAEPFLNAVLGRCVRKLVFN